MSDVIIYSTANCPYCQRAKMLLEAKGVVYDEVRVDLDPARLEEMIERSKRRSVPQIFIHGKSIGGFDELRELEQHGQLDPLLKS